MGGTSYPAFLWGSRPKQGESAYGMPCPGNFTGIDSPYEQPVNPELRLDTTHGEAEALADQVIDHLRQAGIIGSGGEPLQEFSI